MFLWSPCLSCTGFNKKGRTTHVNKSKCESGDLNLFHYSLWVDKKEGNHCNDYRSGYRCLTSVLVPVSQLLLVETRTWIVDWLGHYVAWIKLIFPKICINCSTGPKGAADKKCKYLRIKMNERVLRLLGLNNKLRVVPQTFSSLHIFL